MTPDLPPDPNITLLPIEAGVCAVLVIIALVALYAWERRHPDGSDLRHKLPFVLLLAATTLIPSCNLQIEPGFTLTDKDGNAISLTLKTITIDKESGK